MHLLPSPLLHSSSFPATPPHKTAAQPATTDAPFTITFESLRLTHTGFIVTVSYVNTLAEPLQLTLTYPQDKSSFAADNLGNEYTLTNATGMARRHNDPNLDITQPSLTEQPLDFSPRPAPPKSDGKLPVQAHGRGTTRRPTNPPPLLSPLASMRDPPKTSSHLPSRNGALPLPRRSLTRSRSKKLGTTPLSPTNRKRDTYVSRFLFSMRTSANGTRTRYSSKPLSAVNVHPR